MQTATLTDKPEAGNFESLQRHFGITRTLAYQLEAEVGSPGTELEFAL